MKKFYLVVDTSGENISAASVAEEGGKSVVLEEGKSSQRFSHCEFISTLVERVTRERGLNFEQCKGIVATAGPGSFTGLRIGASFARGLALALQKELFLLSLFDVAVWSFNHAVSSDALPPTTKVVCPGRRNSFSYIDFSNDAFTTTEGHDIKPCYGTFDAFNSYEVKNEKVIFLGDVPKEVGLLDGVHIYESDASLLGKIFIESQWCSERARKRKELIYGMRLQAKTIAERNHEEKR